MCQTIFGGILLGLGLLLACLMTLQDEKGVKKGFLIFAILVLVMAGTLFVAYSPPVDNYMHQFMVWIGEKITKGWANSGTY